MQLTAARATMSAAAADACRQADKRMWEDDTDTYFERSSGSHVLGDLYPEIEGRTLAMVIQEALRRIGSALSSDVGDPPQGSPTYARFDSSGRSSQVYVAASERLFLVDFWAKGVPLARGRGPEIDRIASAIDRWLAARVTTTELAAAFPFVSQADRAVDFEEGRAAEATWNLYLQRVAKDFPELTAFARLAYETPRLRRLFPFTSMSRFCFSRCTGYPYTTDCPVVWCTGGGKHTVRVPGAGEFDGLTAEAAIQLVLCHLPRNAGPAVDGTADDLETGHEPRGAA